jgi:hypothetical protein
MEAVRLFRSKAYHRGRSWRGGRWGPRARTGSLPRDLSERVSARSRDSAPPWFRTTTAW